MKRVFIIHGWGGNPQEPMLQYFKKELEAKGFQSEALEMPKTDEPEISAWVLKLKESVSSPDEQTFFIGHSIGCQTILRYLETLPSEVRVGGAVLVAPWMHLDSTTIEEEGPEVVDIAKPWMETPIDWEKVKSVCDRFFCVFSDNDPYVPLSDEKLFKSMLGAETVILHEKGHFDPDSNITELPLAVEKTEEMANNMSRLKPKPLLEINTEKTGPLKDKESVWRVAILAINYRNPTHYEIRRINIRLDGQETRLYIFAEAKGIRLAEHYALREMRNEGLIESVSSRRATQTGEGMPMTSGEQRYFATEEGARFAGINPEELNRPPGEQRQLAFY